MWIDVHCHTRYSYDNWLEPLQLIRRAAKLGLDAVCITEHHSFEASEPVEHIAREEGFLVLRGLEVSTDKGHLLVFGVADDSWNRWGRNTYLPIEPIIEYVNELGGVCIPAHPFREIGLCSLMERIMDLDGIAGVETHNGGNLDSDNELALRCARHLGVPSLGGSDCHKVDAVGRCATRFDTAVTDLVSFIAAVRAGACHGAYYDGHARSKEA